MHDFVTGLYNRRYFDEIWKQERCRSERYQTPLAICCLRLLNLPLIERAHGRKAADQAVALAGRGIRQHVRGSDIAARYADDAFVVVFTHTNSVGARRAGHRLAEYTHAAAATALGFDVQLEVGVQGAEGGYGGMLERAFQPDSSISAARG